jgi:hypothetical protein
MIDGLNRKPVFVRMKVAAQRGSMATLAVRNLESSATWLDKSFSHPYSLPNMTRRSYTSYYYWTEAQRDFGG